jgi:molybdopterin-synthase adenylyltransferase
MSRLSLTSELLVKLRAELFKSPEEACAVLFGRAIVKQGRLARIVARDIQWMKSDDYEEQTNIAARLRPEVVSTIAQRARKSGESLIFVHSHPFPLNQFSSTDDAGEKLLAEFLDRRTPEVVHAAMLITPEVTIARVLGSGETLEVIGVGSQLLWGRDAATDADQASFDRQMRVFGAVGQDRLREMRVGIVGLGGTGSVVLEQLAHLGVRRFLLMDPDVVERTNLNRLVGAIESDVGKPKVEVAAAYAKRINPSADVETRRGSVLLAREAEELVATDFVFCCTDSQGSRAVLNQFAYQYLVPVIDMGAAIIITGGRISHIAGRTQMLAPGLGCLVCGDLLSPEAVRVDLLTDFERAADPYVVGVHEPAPAVVSLNATIASMAVTMFLAATIGVPSQARMLNYNGVTGAARPTTISPHPTCIACSSSGALARANECPLPARLS